MYVSDRPSVCQTLLKKGGGKIMSVVNMSKNIKEVHPEFVAINYK